MSFISSFDIASDVFLDPRILLWSSASAANATAVNPSGISNCYATGWSTFFLNGKRFFSNGPRSLPRNPLD